MFVIAFLPSSMSHYSWLFPVFVPHICSSAMLQYAYGREAVMSPPTARRVLRYPMLFWNCKRDSYHLRAAAAAAPPSIDHRRAAVIAVCVRALVEITRAPPLLGTRVYTHTFLHLLNGYYHITCRRRHRLLQCLLYHWNIHLL